MPQLPRLSPMEVKHRLEMIAGDPARVWVVALLAGVLALENADLATVGAVGPQLESQLHISNVELGLLATISILFGVLMTVPFGILADRVRRVDMLAAVVASWALVMVVSAAAQDYDWLLLSRLGLGLVTAAASPIIASLTGDFFPASERGKIYGYILSGELLGTGFGFIVSGGISSALSWRWGFAVLALPAILLAALIWRGLAEPARGGGDKLAPGAKVIADGAQAPARSQRSRPAPDAAKRRSGGILRRAIIADGVGPDSSHVLDENPARMPLGRVIRYVLSVRTNIWLIVASAIGYFFFAGMRTFGVVFVRGHYSLTQGSAIAVLFVAGLGSVAGVLVAGRLADRLVLRGRVAARVMVGGISYSLVALFLLPALLLDTVILAVPLLIMAGAAMSAPNPPLDAARLDIMPAALWGRAEAVRETLRSAAQAGAPLLFGTIADALGTGGDLAFSSPQQVSAGTARGLEYTFLIMLIPLMLNGVMLLIGARRSYPADVATALASEQAVAAREGEPAAVPA